MTIRPLLYDKMARMLQEEMAGKERLASRSEAITRIARRYRVSSHDVERAISEMGERRWSLSSLGNKWIKFRIDDTPPRR